MGSIQVLPEEFPSNVVLSHFNQLLETEEHGATDLVHNCVLIHDLEKETVGCEWPLDWEPELLLQRGHVVLGRHWLGLEDLASELGLDVGINGAKGVHFWQFFCRDISQLELLEFFLDLCGHHDCLVGSLWSSSVIELDLLVSWTLDGDGDLQVASDLTEVFTVGVEESHILVLERMLVFKVDSGDVKVIGSNHFISEHALVHDFDGDGFALDGTGVDASWLKEEMLSPADGGLTLAGHAILGCGVLGDSTGGDIDDGAESVTKSNKTHVRLDFGFYFSDSIQPPILIKSECFVSFWI